MFNRINLFLLSVMLLVPSVVFAQEVPPEDFSGLLTALIEAAKGGEWSVVVSVSIMLLVFLATKVKFIGDWIPKGAKPWVAAGAGVLAAVATEAFTSGNWLSGLLKGLVTGAAASGFWELVGKHFAGSSTEEVVAEPTE